MKRIMIIDDDAHIGNLEQELLEQEGYAVLRAYSGTEALLLLKESRPDLVLLDLMLPGLHGEALLPQLAGIPVIVVSAKADTADKVSLLLGGAADYITKPFASKELLAHIAVRLREKVHSSPGSSVFLRRFDHGYGGSACHRGRKGHPADAHGICDFKTADAESGAGGRQVHHSGAHQPGHCLFRILPV